MTIFDFYVGLREEILKQISGIDNSNANWGWSWDDSTPNCVVKERLELLLGKYVPLAKEFGVYIVTRYPMCKNPKHWLYPTTNRYGIPIPYKDARFVWSGRELFHGWRLSICPCSSTNEPRENMVIDEFICDKAASIGEFNKIALIFEDISAAIMNSKDKKSRSGIREYLLRAVLRINDAILPQSVDEYIAQRRENM
ncbi:hypothetical protein E8F11_11295 [Pseudomonas sp. BN417]|uniref:hypothetical protein n=1 Tax=Pseudomonas sp. BN417 TaxID=2567890 RepID=UPI002457BEB5|nr:hypothetical protein [Pseudomonas sp. BN417]MDH4555749.1 hypothetical protein [Pseudomonas sp. BN417]